MTKPSQDQLNNGFETWVDGSISAAPVYQTFFHATAIEFDEFEPFPHFGTLQAATDRSYHRQSKHRFVEVWLAIKRPWTTYDNSSSNQVSQLAMHAVQEGAIDAHALQRILDRITTDAVKWQGAGSRYSAMKWQLSMRPFADELQAVGYDALCYENAVEDKGSTSFIPFETNQIWWVDSNDPQR
ncbi:hypothetical protein [Sphingomonas sp. BK235]|uniref:hypothetical protein n=1 Tax=Sphingomonas sp. BK235 TaxID=2512131 RepID=UPI001042CD13|nr:hypothetical protein [Sphingomonas sp. BK235]TCP32407.1 hypothetical protein EV292_10839 [Sphingomonas sp. BK235]